MFFYSGWKTGKIMEVNSNSTNLTASPGKTIEPALYLFNCFTNSITLETKISFYISENTKNRMLSIIIIRGQCLRKSEIKNKEFKINSLVCNGEDVCAHPVCSGKFYKTGDYWSAA